MRSRILSSLFLASVLVPPAVWAQQQDTESRDTEPSTETEGSAVVDDAPPSRNKTPRPGEVVLPKGAQPGRESAPGQVHTVERGDTLWDLSQRYLGSPWYWPKVWSYNPDIANPHWIYPGNNVRFFPAGEEVPSRVETGIGPAPADNTEAAPADDLGNGADLVINDRRPTLGNKPLQVTTQGFVTARELDEAGRIEGATTGAEMLSFPDMTYVRFKSRVKARKDEQYIIFHTVKEVRHPVTGRTMGYLTEFVGKLRVESVGPNYVRAQITNTWDAVARGDLVGPFDEKLVETVVERPNEKEVKGFIVTALVPYLTITAEHHVLVIDRGSSDGVQVGNTFTVLRQGDPARRTVLKPDQVNQRAKGPTPTFEVPAENIALCLVTEVKERASNCILVRSIQEVNPGDSVIMRVPEPTTAQR